MIQKILPHDFIKMKKAGKKIIMVTAYTYYQAKVADEVGIDGILVGDSLGMVIMGYTSTLPVTFEEVLHHVRAVVNAKPKALIVADMPFLSYEVSTSDAVRNAGMFLKAGADAVKLEGGSEITNKVEALVKAGIPVMGHIGLNPQRYLVTGGYKLRGKKAEDALQIVESARALQEAGVFSIVIENTAAQVAEEVTKQLKVPTICIGAGPSCDGQILVFHDVVGLNPSPPYFARQYADAYGLFKNALANYLKDVKEGRFPGSMEFKMMSDEEERKFYEMLRRRGLA